MKIKFIKNGVTLIELLTVLALISLISGIGFAAFGSYLKNQQLQQSADTVKTIIEKTKFNSVSRINKPSGCGALEGYRFYIDNINPPNQYSVRANCSNDDNIIVQTFTLPGNIVFSNQSKQCTIDFLIKEEKVVFYPTSDEKCRLTGAVPAICKVASWQDDYACIQIVGSAGYNKIVIIDKFGNVTI